MDGTFGMPEGWVGIERKFGVGSKCFGQTYIRYASSDGKHKGISSVKVVVQKDAEVRGLDPVKAVQDYEAGVKAHADKKKKEMYEAGFMKGEERDQMVQIFKDKCGPLNGATICQLPGWRGESHIIESGQKVATYYDPSGRAYKLVNQVEAMFGVKISNGEDIPDIEAAREACIQDESGKAINVARQEHVVGFDGERAPARKKRRLAEENTAGRVVTHADYAEADISVGSAGADASVSVAAVEIQRLLVQRGFSTDVKLLSVTCKDVNVPGHTSADVFAMLSGMYYEMGEEFNERPVYQKVFLKEGRSGLGCHGLYLSWSQARSCWKLGRLGDDVPGYAMCLSDEPRPTEVAAKWLLLAPKAEV